jgi:membrane associated rhomboid family serine protease
VARAPDRLQQVLTLGGRAPRVVGGLLVAMALATLAGSLAPELGQLLALRVPAPESSAWLELLEVWRLLTWPLYQGAFPGGLLDLLFGGLTLVWLGQQLSFAWSERRFLTRCAVVAAGAGLLTVLLFSALGLPFAYAGIWPLTMALLLTWGLVFPGQRVSWFGVLDMSGATVAKVVAVGTPLWALVAGPSGAGAPGRLLAYTPHLMALLVAWLALADGPRRRWHRVKGWWARRRLEAARKRFKVITTDGPPPRQWMN